MNKYTIDDIKLEFKKLYKDNKFIISKSGIKTLEIIDADFEVRPTDFTIFGELNNYANRELEWYLSQSLSVLDIPGKIPPIWMNISTKDEKHEINSNYGWMEFSKENYEQYNYALQDLLNDPTTRRACHIYTRPSIWIDYNRNGMSDYICTFATQQFIRNNKLIYSVTMRSNDANRGFKNDLYWARYIANKLIEDLNKNGMNLDKEPIIHWHANSLHLYESDFHYLEEK